MTTRDELANAPWRIWIQAARPKTLPAAAAPVIIGVALAVADGGFHALSASLALLAALLIQVGVNFHNDYTDFLRGTDTDERVGPLRVTQAGLVDPDTMRRATFVVFFVAVLAGSYLIVRGGWPVVAIGVASIASALWYTAGRYSLAYIGLADLFVFMFFGPVAVAGTYYVQTLTVTAPAVAAGVGPGALSVCILLVNNIRDLEGDREADKRTLVVRLGRTFGVWFYAFCMLVAALVPPALVGYTGEHWGALLATPTVALAGPALQTLRSGTTDAHHLNPLLATTGRALALYSLCFALGWVLT
ncbi:MAG: 1,4-dihydroxy-2-naphthoate polyprenyltransferase [Longimonas sp.]|uniref:1,4-dihydroxy-2-naphthoate polyprenyltransferase n=1 Tax=Longimonas sp. TaxID=2039626 RepID=UPI0033563B4F